MKILVACEESQRVTVQLRERESMKFIRVILNLAAEVTQSGTFTKMYYRC